MLMGTVSFSLERSKASIRAGYGGIELAKQWLEACSLTHTLCKPKDNGPLPTRLLYLQDAPVRLELTAGWQTRPLYATLSHCWGSLEFLTLTRDTVDAFTTSIPVDQLTKTFRDAIDIAKSLGLEYLWIDSLCLYFDRYRTKYLRNLRFRFALEEFSQTTNQEHQKNKKAPLK
jgi:hypothetical protein